MSDLKSIIAELKAGSNDLAKRLAKQPNLERSDQLQLALADQQYRKSQSLDCSANHYLQILPWVVQAPAALVELILGELSPEAASANLAALQSEVAGRLNQVAPSLQDQLQRVLNDWHAEPLEETALEELADSFAASYKQGGSPRIEHWLILSPRLSRSQLLFECIQIEADQFRRRGQAIDWESYRKRFPDSDYLSTIDEAYEELQRNDQPRIPRDNSPPSDNLFLIGDNQDSTKPYEKRISEYKVGDELNGRYLLNKLLGSGSFGDVFLAFDNTMDRVVAVKVIKDRFESTARFPSNQQFKEAQFQAKLAHPNIVPVYDATKDRNGNIFIVSRFIDGGTLIDQIKKNQLDYRQIATIVQKVAEALYVADCEKIIHRDIKPANILIERETQEVFVADFGLATRQDDYLEKQKSAGSTPYKSPEQVRREGHRLNGRSDLFSLGTVMYELLTGSRPFQGNHEQIEHNILYQNPPNPSSLKPGVPLELERICMKLLRKDPFERHPNGEAVANDLKSWLDSQTEPTRKEHLGPAKIQPRGLQSFNKEDSEFFLELLPGLRDRNGIPECVTYWTEKLQSRDEDHSFAVGLLLGPSGSGKSSLVKAGIMPLLPKNSIEAILLDATPEDTEARLLKAMHKSLPGLRKTISLTEAILKIHECEAPKVVVFIDQFEQWLSANENQRQSELTNALRQCDGKTFQAVLIVRDDFGSVTSYMTNDLETPIERGRNFASIKFFDSEHAKKVLIKFGQAYGKLPEDLLNLSQSQQTFIDKVIEEFVHDTRNQGVIPVQLALFADMIKSKPWESDTLDRLGGTAGLVGEFLDEAFSSLNPQNRMHEAPARKLLKALLPGLGSDLKGNRKTHEELMKACGYEGNRNEFRGLLGLLDGRLRLIKPAEDQLKSYQLTHDYLVTPLRQWLTRKQRETLRGRAEIVLTERADAWAMRKESKQLPSITEWIKIRFFTRPETWTTEQRAMMQRSDKQQSTRLAICLITCVATLWSSLQAWKMIEVNRTVDRWINNPLENLAVTKPFLKKNARQIAGKLRNIADQSVAILRSDGDPIDAPIATNPDSKLRALIGLNILNYKISNHESDFVLRSMIDRPEAEFSSLMKLVSMADSVSIATLKGILDDPSRSKRDRLYAAAAITQYSNGEDNPLSDDQCNFVAHEIANSAPDQLENWIDAFGRDATKEKLIEFLKRQFSTGNKKTTIQRHNIARIISRYAKDRPKDLAEALVDSDKDTYEILLKAIQLSGNGKSALEKVYNEEYEQTRHHPYTDQKWKDVDPESKDVIERHSGMITDRSAFVYNLPIQQSRELIEKLRDYGYRPCRIRPWLWGPKNENQTTAENEKVLMLAAVFTRDGKGFDIDWDVDISELPSPDSAATKTLESGEFILEDLSHLPTTNAQENRFVALWKKSESEDGERRVLIDLTEKGLIEKDMQIREDFGSIRITAQCDPDQQRRYTVIYQKGLSKHDLHLNHEGEDIIFRPQVDVAAIHGGEPILKDYVKEAATQYYNASDDERLSLILSNPTLYAIATYRNRDYQQTINIIDTLTKSRPPKYEWKLFRLLATVHLQKGSDKTDGYSDYQKFVSNEAEEAYGKIRYVFLTEGFQAALDQIDLYTKEHGDNPYFMFSVMCAACGCASETENENERTELTNLALSKLEFIISSRFFSENEYLVESDLVLLYDLPAFRNAVKNIYKNSCFSSISGASPNIESKLVRLENLGDDGSIIDDYKYLVDSRWEPISVGVSDGMNQASSSGSQPMVMLFQRQLEGADEKEIRARRKAMAALALHHLGDPSFGVALLNNSSNDNSVRSYFQSYLVAYADTIPTNLDGYIRIFQEYPEDVLENAPGRTQKQLVASIAITLGDFLQAGILGNQQIKQRDDIVLQALELFKKDGDPGIHGACRWLLEIAETPLPQLSKVESSDPDSLGGRTWMTSSTNNPQLEHTLAIVGPGEFISGSPIDEDGRLNGALGYDEFQHRVSIPYRVAIATHETTVEQFRRFSSDHGLNSDISRGLQNAPVHGVSWFQAAKYCNLLSKEEGIPEDQWCYLENADGSIEIPGDLLRRKGYRLPTLYEYEYACRSGSQTSRPYGVGKELLGRFAWCVPWDGAQYTLSAGSLRPNDWGFFDLLGNVFEWSSDILPADEPLEQLAGKQAGRKLFRARKTGIFARSQDDGGVYGGAHSSRTKILRCSSKPYYGLTKGFDTFGFRVARTVSE